MTSKISWIDYSTKEREASMKALALMKGPDSRDELGIGAIRDSLSDLMFPGTSTLQTRLKYFLIIPWMYKKLESEGVMARNFINNADTLERSIIEILSGNEDTDGVIGLVAGKNLKILPSTMYWSGLKTWGIFESDKSKDEYSGSIDLVYKARSAFEKLLKSRKSRSDEWQDDRFWITKTWNEGLPETLKEFPKDLTLEMTKEEAEYIQDRIILSQKDSLLAFLAKNIIHSESEYLISHELYNNFNPTHKKQVETAYKFSTLIQGAAFLYNLMLAERKGNNNLIQQYRSEMNEWQTKTSLLADWDIDELWKMIDYPESAHKANWQTRSFLEEWFSLCFKSDVHENQDARNLIESREKKLKRSKSRFSSAHMLDKWGGRSGIGFIDNRWGIAKRLLNDLYTGLEGK